MADRVTHAPVETALEVDPKDRVTHAPVEVAVEVNPADRVTHAPVETALEVDSTVRVTQQAAAALGVGPSQVRVSYLVVELLLPNVVAFFGQELGTATEEIRDRSMGVLETGVGHDEVIETGVGGGQMGGRIEDHIEDAPDAWERDMTRDARELTYSASDPSEIASYTTDGSIDHTGWVRIVVPETCNLRITTEGSSVHDTLLFLYDSLPGAGDSAVAVGDDISAVQEPTLTGLPYSVLWSRIDVDNIAPGEYWVCVLPKDGASFDWTEGKDLLVSVRRY